MAFPTETPFCCLCMNCSPVSRTSVALTALAQHLPDARAAEVLALLPVEDAAADATPIPIAPDSSVIALRPTSEDVTVTVEPDTSTVAIEIEPSSTSTTQITVHGAVSIAQTDGSGDIILTNAPDIETAPQGASDATLVTSGTVSLTSAPATPGIIGVRAAAAPPFTDPNNVLLTGLDTGFEITGHAGTSATTRIDYFFAGFAREFLDDGSTRYRSDRAWTTYEEARIAAAFDFFESFLDVEFVETPFQSQAEISFFAAENFGTFSQSVFTSAGSLGFAFLPTGSPFDGNVVFNVDGFGWDSSAAAGSNFDGGLEQFGLGFSTVIHEIGHTLGLDHPHDSSPFSTLFPGLVDANGDGSADDPFNDTGSFGLNQSVYTIMSYATGWTDHPFGTADVFLGEAVFNGSGRPGGFVGTPMALDIAVLQQKYGANMTFAAGNDTYTLPDTQAQTTGYAAIWDTGGTDQIVYAGARDTTIDLRAATLQVEDGGGGFVSFVDGRDFNDPVVGGFTIANGVVIENATTDGGDDVLTGNDAGNILSAGAGADTLTGGAGDDTLQGGAGADVAVFAGNAADYTVSDLTANSLRLSDGGADALDEGTDLLVDIETLRFADQDIAFADLAQPGIQVPAQGLSVHETAREGWSIGFVAATDPEGDPLTFALSGTGATNFAIDSVTGEVSVAAGAALDFETTASYTLTLTASDASGSTSGTLTITLDDVLEATAGNDTQSSASLFWFEGSAGADQITGRASVADGVDYRSSDAGVVLVLNAVATGGHATGDTLGSIETVSGSIHGDVITGDGNANDIRGWDGNDTLSGGAGADRIEGEDGDDRIDGGDGADTLSGGAGADQLNYLSAGTGVTLDLEDGTASTGAAAGDIISGFEFFVGSTHGDDIRGDASANFLLGDAGDDTLQGRDGDDVLTGGAGGDTLNGGAGNDRAQYTTAATGVTVDLVTAANNAGDAAGDSYISIENVFGSRHGDDLRGNGGVNFLTGWLGDDTLSGGSGDDILTGGAGGDLLDGGAGRDRAQYTDALTGLTADLGNAASNTGDAAGDSYVSVEDIFGSRFDDIIRGNNNQNFVLGWFGNDTLFGQDGNDFLVGGEGADTMDGGAGYDRAQYTTALTGVTLDLGNSANNTGDAVGDVFISIEQIYGSRFDDILRGDGAANDIIGWLGNDLIQGNDGHDGLFGDLGDDTLEGGAGSDRLEGGAGADIHDGGSGSDRVQYFGAATGVTADLSNAANNTGDAAGDSYISIENLTGSRHDDDLRGDGAVNYLLGLDGNDTLMGQGGDDRLLGGIGADSIDGGAGNDRAEYSDALSGIRADLSNSANNTGIAAGDTYTSVEYLFGSRFGDHLTGDAGDNWLWGEAGDDTLEGGDGRDNLLGGAGADLLDGGGGGADRVRYSSSTIGVTVDMANGANNTGEAAGDVLVNIEELYGSRHDDTLRGDDNANLLLGWLGNDTLEGGLGNDNLFGLEDNDLMTGGGGIDTFWFAPNSGIDTITDFSLGEDRIRLVSTGLDFSSLILSDDAGDAVVDYLTGTIRLSGIDVNQLDQNDFIIS